MGIFNYFCNIFLSEWNVPLLSLPVENYYELVLNTEIKIISSL